MKGNDVQVGVVGRLGEDVLTDNVSDALERLGHAVTQLGPAGSGFDNGFVSRGLAVARQALPAMDDRAQRRIVRAAAKAACEVVISVDRRLVPDAVARLKGNGAKVAFWFPDAVSNIGRQTMLLAPYDAIFFKEPFIVDRFQAMLDLPVYYLPQACNPRWHRPLTEAGTDPFLVTAGNMYPSRVRLLERLMAKGIPIRLYGSGFPRWLRETSVSGTHMHRYVVREEKARIFRSAAGVLNTLHPAEVQGVNVRLFEAAGCGAAVLTEFRPTLPDLFAMGEEVLAYSDFDDLLDKATRLLNEAGITARLGDAAAKRAHRDHTYDLRVAKILQALS
jgi:spore maturation protein CgeB